MTFQATNKLKAGYGYWDITNHPVGGAFHRAPTDGLPIRDITHFKPHKGTNAQAIAFNGTKKLVIAFNSAFLEAMVCPAMKTN